MDEAGRGTEVLVSAAASLSDAFAEIVTAFEAANPGITVALNLAGSPALRAQIMEGAPVDVFASASTTIMQQLIAAAEVSQVEAVFAENRLIIAVPPGNPGGVTDLTDFARAELLLGLCGEAVPCGSLARRVFERAGVSPVVDTDEPDVRALLTKIALGELDAGIVYVTDVRSAGDAVLGVQIPDSLNLTTGYPIAVLDGARHPVEARLFVAFVLSVAGQAILARHGFVAS